jgi:hypothetical protein
VAFASIANPAFAPQTPSSYNSLFPMQLLCGILYAHLFSFAIVTRAWSALCRPARDRMSSWAWCLSSFSRRCHSLFPLLHWSNSRGRPSVYRQFGPFLPDSPHILILWVFLNFVRPYAKTMNTQAAHQPVTPQKPKLDSSRKFFKFMPYKAAIKAPLPMPRVPIENFRSSNMSEFRFASKIALIL